MRLEQTIIEKEILKNICLYIINIFLNEHRSS